MLKKHKILLYHFRLIAPPKRVQSDCGTEFQNAVKVFYKSYGIQHITSCAYHP